MGIDDHQRAWQLGHAAHPLEVAPDLPLFPVQRRDHFLAVLVDLAGLLHALQLVQALEPPADRAEVGERAAQPPFAHVMHAAAFGFLLHNGAGLAFRANENHLFTVSGELNGELAGDHQTAERLTHIDDVNQVALAINVRLHPRVPSTRPMPEVYAGLDKLLSCHEGQKSVLHVTLLTKKQNKLSPSIGPRSVPLGSRIQPLGAVRALRRNIIIAASLAVSSSKLT